MAVSVFNTIPNFVLNVYVNSHVGMYTQCTNSYCLGTELTFCSAVSISSLYSFRTRGDGESFLSCKSSNSSSIFWTDEEIDRTFLCRASSRKCSLHPSSTFKLGRIPSPWELQGPVHKQHEVGHHQLSINTNIHFVPGKSFLSCARP